MKELVTADWMKEKRWTPGVLTVEFNVYAKNEGIRISRQTAHNWASKGRTPLPRSREILKTLALGDNINLVFPKKV